MALYRNFAQRTNASLAANDQLYETTKDDKYNQELSFDEQQAQFTNSLRQARQALDTNLGEMVSFFGPKAVNTGFQFTTGSTLDKHLTNILKGGVDTAKDTLLGHPILDKEGKWYGQRKPGLIDDLRTGVKSGTEAAQEGISKAQTVISDAAQRGSAAIRTAGQKFGSTVTEGINNARQTIGKGFDRLRSGVSAAKRVAVDTTEDVSSAVNDGISNIDNASSEYARIIDKNMNEFSTNTQNLIDKGVSNLQQANSFVQEGLEKTTTTAENLFNNASNIAGFVDTANQGFNFCVNDIDARNIMGNAATKAQQQTSAVVNDANNSIASGYHDWYQEGADEFNGDLIGDINDKKTDGVNLRAMAKRSYKPNIKIQNTNPEGLDFSNISNRANSSKLRFQSVMNPPKSTFSNSVISSEAPADYLQYGSSSTNSIGQYQTMVEETRNEFNNSINVASDTLNDITTQGAEIGNSAKNFIDKAGEVNFGELNQAYMNSAKGFVADAQAQVGNRIDEVGRQANEFIDNGEKMVGNSLDGAQRNILAVSDQFTSEADKQLSNANELLQNQLSAGSKTVENVSKATDEVLGNVAKDVVERTGWLDAVDEVPFLDIGVAAYTGYDLYQQFHDLKNAQQDEPVQGPMHADPIALAAPYSNPDDDSDYT